MCRVNVGIAGITAIAASLATIAPALAQPLVVTSQRFTFQLPGQSAQIVEPATPGPTERNASLTQTINGGFGGSGIVETSGTARGTTNWTSTSITWSAEATISNSILEAFELDDYAELGVRAQVITEVRFQILESLQVQLTRSNATGTSSGSDFLNDFGQPYIYPLDSLGEPIMSQGILVGFSDPAQTLLPGNYLARIRSAAIVVTTLGNAPVAGSASTSDGATMVVVPGPGTLALLGSLSVVATRRRRSLMA